MASPSHAVSLSHFVPASLVLLTSGMTMLEFLRHSLPFQTQPSGHSGGGPASSSGQVSLFAVCPVDVWSLGVSLAGVEEPQA